MTPAEYRVECEVATELRNDLAQRIAAASHGIALPGAEPDATEEESD